MGDFFFADGHKRLAKLSKYGRVRQPNLPEFREMGTPLNPGPRIQPVKQPRTATATTGFLHVKGET